MSVVLLSRLAERERVKSRNQRKRWSHCDVAHLYTVRRSVSPVSMSELLRKELSQKTGTRSTSKERSTLRIVFTIHSNPHCEEKNNQYKSSLFRRQFPYLSAINNLWWWKIADPELSGNILEGFQINYPRIKRDLWCMSNKETTFIAMMGWKWKLTDIKQH